MKQLHPGALWQFRLKGLIIAIIFLWAFGWILMLPFGSLIGDYDSLSDIVLFLAGIFIFYAVIAVIIAEIYARMSYNRWFYEFMKDNLKLERGIIWKRYSNVPYNRVQNVDITRGIIARIFGFSTVNIQTAGFAYAGRRTIHSEGHIPAVAPDEAEHIRDFLMKKIGKRAL